MNADMLRWLRDVMRPMATDMAPASRSDWAVLLLLQLMLLLKHSNTTTDDDDDDD